MRRHRIWAALIATLALAACEAPAPRTDASATPAPPLFETFGQLHRDIGTPVPAAQRYFDQGLRLAYGFNHEAAGRAFAEAARLDPQCAICVWGQALVLGPNINLPMQPDVVPQAAALAKKALSLADNAKPADRALIEALAKRYADPAPADRAPLDKAYADAMANVVAQFPDDDDAQAMYAEALMDLTPWNYWTAGKPNADTPKILGAIETVLKRNPKHIGAIHYYIHAVEASDDPGRAEALADTLGGLAPGSGHLVHMPAHIYIRTGRYNDATLANFRASTADKEFLAVCRGTNGMYPLGYVPHNWHFATLSAGLMGSRTLATQASDQTAQHADMEKLDALNFMQHFVVVPMQTEVRFGEWDAILARTQSPAPQPYPTGIWHFARGMAQLRKGNMPEAERELAALQALADDPAMAKLMLGTTNYAGDLLKVGAGVLQGEIASSQGKHDQAIAALRKAGDIEDKLTYNEPADWPLPVSNYLGAALLKARRPADAVKAFENDLQKFPKNGWGLYGLAQAQDAMGDKHAAAETRKQFQAAWQWADTPLQAAVF
ncbi:tetratricopeptide repeat protein [Lysobacter sp. 2RAF19]